jgi:hypothetical protein
VHKSEDLAFEIAKNNQVLFQDIATAQALFPNTQQLRDLCTPIYKFHTLALKAEVPHTGPVEGVTQWKDTAEREVQPLAESEYGKPIDALVEFLQPQLPQ